MYMYDGTNVCNTMSFSHIIFNYMHQTLLLHITYFEFHATTNEKTLKFNHFQTHDEDVFSSYQNKTPDKQHMHFKCLNKMK
jgi:hypothetical protein